MALQTEIYQLKIKGSEWYKASDRAPFKVAAENQEGNEITLIYWGKTHPGRISKNEWYEAEISSIKTNNYGTQYTLNRTADEHGVKHLVKVEGNEKVEPIKDLKLVHLETIKTRIMIISEWSKAYNTNKFRMRVRALDTEFVEDCDLTWIGLEEDLPHLIKTKHYQIEGSVNVMGDGIVTITLHKVLKKLPSMLDPTGDPTPIPKEIQVVKQKQPEKTDHVFIEIFNAMQEDSLNYVPGYKTYRASSVNTCPRKILLSKWEVDLTRVAQEKVEQIRKAYNYDRNRTGATWVGTAIHEFVEQIMKGKGIYVSSEEKIRIQLDGITFVGHYDLLLKIEGQRYVADIKTTNPKYTGTKYEYKLEDHFKQLNIYQHYFDGIPGLIIYVERNAGKVTIFKHEYDKQQFKETVKQFKDLAKHEGLHELPVIPKGFAENMFPCWKGEWQCEFWYSCWREEA